MLVLSQKGLDLIKRFERCSLVAYKCPAGVWTIGYGHTDGVKSGDTLTPERAEELLLMDIEAYEEAVLQALEVPVSENQFAALVSFTYNVGIAAFLRSNLLKKLNAGKDPSDEFLKWVNGGGRRLPGLVKRREAERELFRTA